jgi:hypothetical protein
LSSVKVGLETQVILFSKNFFLGAHVILKEDIACLTTVDFNDKASSLKIILTPKPAPKFFPIIGMLKDAVTGKAVTETEGIIIIAQGKDGKKFSARFNNAGFYTFKNLVAGVYKFSIVAPGWIDTHEERIVTAENSTHENIWDFTISRELKSNQWRIVLSWAAEPKDLDSTLVLPNREVIYYRKRISRDGQVTLDTDSRDGFGPETITITNTIIANQKMRYYVKNFSRRPSITVSQAIVQVYHGDRLAHVFKVPTSGYGLYWYVFDLGANGIFPVNKLVRSSR